MDNRKLPIFKALIDSEQDGLMAVSLVDEPAVESDFLAFAKDKAQMQFKVQDEEKRLVLGCVMRADFPMYRYDEWHGEFLLEFDAPTIAVMAEKMLQEGTYKNVDTNHNGRMVEGVNLRELFIKDTAKGIAPAGFEDISEGSLFGVFHVTNDDIWKQIKEGQYAGFSLLGDFTIQYQPSDDEQEIFDLLEEIGKYIR